MPAGDQKSLLAGLLAATLSAPAAAVITTTFSTGAALTYNTITNSTTGDLGAPTATIMLPRFALTNRVLQSVTIRFLTELSSAAGFENRTGTSKGPYTANFTTTATLSGSLPNAAAVNLVAAANSSGSVATLARFDGISNYAGTSGARVTIAPVTSATQSVTYTSNLGAFVSAQATSFALSVTAAGTALVPNQQALGNHDEELGGSQSIQVFIDYISDPLPEPSTWAMFIAGFGLIGTALRRRPAPARAA